jgi:hypothetical protein
MKDTAVDFLMGKLFDPSTMVQEQIQWFEQAKEMEKEHIGRAYQQGLIDGMTHSPKDYYNETFDK